MLHTFNN